MTAVLRWVRKTSRLVVAVVLWLNALLLLRVTPPHFDALAKRLHLTAGETTVLVVIAGLSVLFSYGLGNVAVDVLYIYFFPVVVLYLAAKAVYKVGRIFVRHRSRDDSRAGAAGQAIRVNGKREVTPVNSLVSETGSTFRFNWKSVLRSLLRPFLRFTLLWALLLLLTSHRWLLWLAMVIVVVHLARALFRLSKLAVFSIKGLSQLEERLKRWAEQLIAQAITIRTEAEVTDDMKQTWASLSMLQVGVQLMRNRQRLTQWVIFLGLLVVGPIYFYLATLFSFAYYGIARIESIPYTWTEAFVTSVFIPFQFPDLPHNIWIKVLAGVHCSFLVLVGIGTVLGYLQKKVSSLYAAADSLDGRLRDQQLQTSIVILNQRFQPGSKPK